MKRRLRLLSSFAVFIGVILAVVGSVTPADAATPGFGLFQDNNYGGCAFYWTSGSVKIANFANRTYNTTGCKGRGLNDDVSSVSNNCKMWLYTNKNYGGKVQFIPARAYPKSVKFNDQYSSLIFRCG